MSQEHAGAVHGLEDDFYTFNASALGFGGLLQQGRRKIVIPSAASVALSPTGGEGSSLIENYDSHGITCTRAESRVAGYSSRSTLYTTYSDILITNLSVFNRLTVSLMHLTVASTRDTRNEESSFSLHAMYRGVVLDGDEIVPELDLDMCVNSDYKRLAETIRDRQSAAISAKQPPAHDQSNELVRAIDRREPIRSSVVRSIEIRPGDDCGEIEQRNGNVLSVPGFAKMHFGELLVKPGRRRVNLLRFQFAPNSAMEMDHLESVAMSALESHESSHGGGTLTVGSGDGNGAPVWPRE
jgi:hypothetical protein